MKNLLSGTTVAPLFWLTGVLLYNWCHQQESTVKNLFGLTLNGFQSLTNNENCQKLTRRRKQWDRRCPATGRSNRDGYTGRREVRAGSRRGGSRPASRRARGGATRRGEESLQAAHAASRTQAHSAALQICPL